jgi:hypothetical protein
MVLKEFFMHVPQGRVDVSFYHWIFQPEKILVEFSTDGVTYFPGVLSNQPGKNEEHYEVSVKEYTATHLMKKSISYRYIRVTASNLSSLPEWRYREGKKPMIACDEIYVQ